MNTIFYVSHTRISSPELLKETTFKE